MNEPQSLAAMLRPGLTIAVVGLSDDPARASYGVSAYMLAQGYRIFPVNPSLKQVLGQPAYASLTDLPERPDVVNVFRLPKAIPGIVEEMIQLGFDKLWVQQGIAHPEAAALAESSGIQVVMDRCIMVEHARLFRTL